MSREDTLKKWRQSENGKKSIENYRCKSVEQRKKWSKEYYKKNKERILLRTKIYSNNNPNIKIKSQNKAKELGKIIRKSKKERDSLSNAYISALIREEKSDKSIEMKQAEVLIYRLKKIIKKI